MINKAENQLQDRLIKDIEDLKRQVRDIKTAQLIGGDVIKVIPIPTSSYIDSGVVTVTPGLGLTTTITLSSTSQTLTLWNFLYTLYVDGVTSADIFPTGSNLDTAKRKCTFMNWVDWALSSDVTNTRVIKLRARNDDSSNHDYAFHMRAYVPSLTGSAS